MTTPSRAWPWKVAIGAAVLVLFVVLTWWQNHFHLEYAGTRLPSDLGDPVLVLYFMEWGGRCLERGLRGYLEFWNAGFYFPAKMVMTFSDHVIGPAIQASFLHRLGVNEIGGYNFMFLGSFLLCGLTTTWVLRQAGIGLAASILGGIMFAFSPYRSDQRAHLQVLLMQWIPLMLWLWHRLLEEVTPRRALAFVAVYALHVTGGMYLAYLVHAALAILVLQHLDRWRELVTGRALRVLVPTAVVCAALAAAIFVPYVMARRSLGLVRGLGDVGYYGATVASYLAVSPDNLVWGALLGRLARPENQLFAGLIATVLAVSGIRGLWARRRVGLARVGSQAMRRLAPGSAPLVVSERQRMTLAVLLFLCCAGVVLGDLTTLTATQTIEPGLVPERVLGYRPAVLLALGGGGAWLLLSRRWRGAWPLVPPRASSTRWERGLLLVGLFFALLALPVLFAPLQRIVPGLDGMRVPTRAYPFVSFALVFFAALGLDRILAGAEGRRRRLLVAAISVALVFELRGTMQWRRWSNKSEIPGIFQRMASVPGMGAVLHLPIPDVPFDAHYMYFSIAHWRPIVNGYSGYEPPTYLEVKRRVEHELYDASTLDYLYNLGVTHVSVHPFQFKMPRERRRLVRFERTFGVGPGARLREVLVDERDRLWEILPPPPPGTPPPVPPPMDDEEESDDPSLPEESV